MISYVAHHNMQFWEDLDLQGSILGIVEVVDPEGADCSACLQDYRC